MLTQYDEYPVHQAAYPFSFIPNTELTWNDGYATGACDPVSGNFFYTYMRVHHNFDVVEGTVGLVYDGGRHYTVRVSRQWRPDFDTRTGPFSISFLKPMRELRLVLEENDFDLSCDVTWLATAPAMEEAHHQAIVGGRLTTDMTRYSQNGIARGWITIRGQRVDVNNWVGYRDRSWGLYPSHAVILRQLAPYLPPQEAPAVQRAMRAWIFVQLQDHSAFYQWHESRDAQITKMDDVFGTPFEGWIHFGWGEKRPPIRLVDVHHDFEFVPGTKMLSGGKILLRDARGKEWEHRFKVGGAPWWPLNIGSWKDGIKGVVYRGRLHIEDEEIDLRKQPADTVLPSGTLMKGLHGTEYACEFTERSDEGEQNGAGMIEFLIDGRYARYGFDKDDRPSPWVWPSPPAP